MPCLVDRLLPQVEIAVNLLRQSNTVPNVPAYTHLSKPFDYNKMPLAPMSCAIQVHSYYTVDRYYLSTSPDHYITHSLHVKEMRSNWLKDTAHFSHKNITKPTITHADNIIAVITECAKTIKVMGSENGVDEMEHLKRLTERAIATNAEMVTIMLKLSRDQTRDEVRPALTAKGPWRESPDPDQSRSILTTL